MGGEASPSKRAKRSQDGTQAEGKAATKQLAQDMEIPDAQDDFRKVQGTVYDAVAGRLDHQGFILDKGTKPVPPDQVLFRREGAPIRYEESDSYLAHRDLPAGLQLPDSDLLKAIHAYVSDFYGSGIVGDGKVDFRSMDETALMAMGILLEEVAAHSLGNTGDLAFVEGGEKD